METWELALGVTYTQRETETKRVHRQTLDAAGTPPPGTEE